MEELKSIWNLEKYNSELDSLSRDLEELNQKYGQEDIKREHKKIDNRLSILENNGKIIKEAILKYENSLAQYEFNIKKLDDKLYKDNISDIKQLEHLSDEKRKTEERISETEVEMLAYMEEEEIIEENYKTNLGKKESIEQEFKVGKMKLESEIKLLTAKIKELESLKNALIKKIDNDLLEQYRSIRKRKARPIALVEDNTCQGCNMKLPLYQLQDLNQSNKIINCESCGRILYKRE